MSGWNISFLSFSIKEKVSFRNIKKISGYCCSFLFLSFFLFYSFTPLGSQVDHLPKRIQKSLASIFPAETKIKTQTYYLSPIDYSKWKNFWPRHPLSLRSTFYQGKLGHKGHYYAIFDSHIVRSKEETLLFLLDKKGKLHDIQVLTFQEPPEYKAPSTWLKELKGQSLIKDQKKLHLENEVDAITGATLTYQSVLNALKRVMLLHKLHIQ